MPSNLDAVLAYADAHIDDSVARLTELVAIKSISTDPAYAGEVRRAAEWIVADLKSEGFAAEVRDTAGHPVVVAHDEKSAGPRVLFYAHYDVQPVDPVSEWHTDPFAATLREVGGETQIVGRGTSDDKGQLLTFVEACRAWRAVTGSLPLKVTLCLEGEEESGSKNLGPFLTAHKADLGADIALICDTDLWNANRPAITTMLRGLCAEEVEITCASHDLHSGMYGNVARNPIQVLSELIATLRTADGGVAVAGFYDGITELPPDIAALWKQLPYDEKAFLSGAGLTTPAGEKGRSVLEQVRARPSCEINGIFGGYTGDGFKTVIPARASAKISFRLVAGQDPQKIQAAFRKHIIDRLPPDATAKFTSHGLSPAISVPSDGPFLKKAAEALADEWGHQAAIIGSGGSIPVAGMFKQRLGLDTLLIGFARDDDRIHSPNEKYNLTSLHKGIRSWIRVLAAFAEA